MGARRRTDGGGTAGHELVAVADVDVLFAGDLVDRGAALVDFAGEIDVDEEVAGVEGRELAAIADGVLRVARWRNSDAVGAAVAEAVVAVDGRAEARLSGVPCWYGYGPNWTPMSGPLEGNPCRADRR